MLPEEELVVEYDGKSFSLVEDGTGQIWGSFSPIALLRTGGDDYRAGRRVKTGPVKVEFRGGELAAEVSWEHPGGKLKVPLSLVPVEKGVEAEVGPIEGQLPGGWFEVEFPRALGWAPAGSDGYLIIPVGLGAICDFSSARTPRIIEKHVYSGGQTGITMPLIGTVQGNSSLGCIIDTPFDCKVKTGINLGKRRTYFQTLIWAFDDRTNYGRRAHFFTRTGGSYLTIAKRYRREAIDSGRFVGLGEKAEGNGEARLLAGSVLGHRKFSFTEPEGADPLSTENAYGFFRNALRSGFDRVIAHDTGRGSPEEMAEAARFARSLSPGFRLSVYENYLDIFRPGEQEIRPGTKIYPGWDESLVARQRDGSQRKNWRVGRKGKPDLWTYTVCTARRLDVARPQMDDLLDILGRGSIYIDVEGAVPLFDCYDERHPVTKEEDAALRCDLLREVGERFGVVTTESLPQDFLAPVAEVGSYFSTFPYSGYGNSEFRIMPPMIPVPLHTLVWHGSILNQTGTGTSYYQSDPPHAALFGWLADTIDDGGRRIVYKLRGTAYAEMVSHEFLTGPRVIVGPDDAFHCDDVQLTRFSDGTAVVANFASLPYTWRGKKIGPMDFLIYNERLSIDLACPKSAVAGSRVEVAVRVKNNWDRAIPPSSLAIHPRGLAHSGKPLFESGLPGLEAGASVERRIKGQLPGEKGESWFIASVSVPGDQPWEVAEICRCLAT